MYTTNGLEVSGLDIHEEIKLSKIRSFDYPDGVENEINNHYRYVREIVYQTRLLKITATMHFDIPCANE